MIPKNKIISVLHPNVNNKWWAVNMMIYLSNLLKKENNLVFYTFSFDEKLFSKEIYFKINCFNFIKIAYSIRNSDYIIIWNSPMQFVWVLSKIIFFSRAKIIWRHHHYPWYYQNTNVFILFKRFIERLSIRYIDTLVSNSYYLKNSLKDIFNLDSKVLYPVIDKEFTRVTKKEIDFNSKTIFVYGRWSKWKNIKQVFKTYDILKNQIFWLKLAIWWIWEELNFFYENYKNDSNVSFLWLLNKESIIENLINSRVLLFPSKIDSFWMTIIEAMSFGVPVVSFDLNWAKEIVINWKNWYLVDSENDFTDKTFDILTNDSLYKNLSQNALNITFKFDLSNFEKQLQDIF